MNAKVSAAALAVILLIPLVIAVGTSGAISAVLGGGQPSAAALADIPPGYLAFYREAAGVCPGWTGRSSPLSARLRPTTVA